MNIESKVREYKIKKFIEKNKHLDFTEEQLNMLYNIIDFEKLTFQLKKLTSKQKEYVLEPLKYGLEEDVKEYGIKALGSRELYTIIKDQLQITTQKNLDREKVPNLTKLYIATASRPRYDYLYKLLLKKYLSNINSDSVLKEIDVFTRYFLEWNAVFIGQAFREIDCAKILHISTQRLEEIIQYHPPIIEASYTNYKKFNTINSISDIVEEEKISKINKLNNKEFCKLLDFLFKRETITEKKVKLLITAIEHDDQNYYLDREKLRVLETVPVYILNYLVEEIDENETLLENLYDMGTPSLIEEIEKTPNIHYDSLITILELDDFLYLPSKIQETILKELRKNGKEVEYSTIRYEKKVEFLIGTYDQKGFLTFPDQYIIPALNFICQADRINILDEKCAALNRIKKELKKSERYLTLFTKYLEFLSTGLSNKTPTEQINQLHSRSSYFEHNYFMTTMEKINLLTNEEEVLKLLYSNKSPKEMEKYYQFVNIAGNYNEGIIKKIVEHLINVQTAENAQKILDYIETEEFTRSPSEKQEELLNQQTIPGDVRNIEYQGISINIADYNYVKEEIENKGGEMAFINQKTGIKILIKKIE